MAENGIDDLLDFLNLAANTALTATQIQANNANIESDRMKAEKLYDKQQMDKSLKQDYQNKKETLTSQINDNQTRLKEIYTLGRQWGVNIQEHSKLDDKYKSGTDGGDLLEKHGIEIVDGFTSISELNNKMGIMNESHQVRINVQNEKIAESESILNDLNDLLKARHLIKKDLDIKGVRDETDVTAWVKKNKDEIDIIDETFFPEEGDFTLKDKPWMIEGIYSDKFLKNLEPGTKESLDLLSLMQVTGTREDKKQRLLQTPEVFSQSILGAYNTINAQEANVDADKKYKEAIDIDIYALKGTATMWEDEKALEGMKPSISEAIINAAEFFQVKGDIKNAIDDYASGENVSEHRKNAVAKLIVDKLLAEDDYVGKSDDRFGFKKTAYDNAKLDFSDKPFGFHSDQGDKRAKHFMSMLKLWRTVNSAYKDEGQEKAYKAVSLGELESIFGKDKVTDDTGTDTLSIQDKIRISGAEQDSLQAVLDSLKILGH